MRPIKRSPGFAAQGGKEKPILCPKSSSKHPRRASRPAIPAVDRAEHTATNSAQHVETRQPSRFAKLQTSTVIWCFQRLSDILAHPEKLRRKAAERRHRAIELQADAERELRRRVGVDQEAMDFLAQCFADYSAPLLEPDLPSLPAKLERVTEEELERHIADVGRRQAQFPTFYPKLDGSQSRLVRAMLDARSRALLAERQKRENPRAPAPDRIVATPIAQPGPLPTEADAAKKEQPESVDATPLAGPASRGKFCQRVIEQVKRIKNLSLGTGRSVAEVQQYHPDWEVWKVRESLSQEDQDTFNHPRQWGPPVGYAKNILARNEGVSEHTITASVKAYRKSLRVK